MEYHEFNEEEDKALNVCGGKKELCFHPTCAYCKPNHVCCLHGNKSICPGKRPCPVCKKELVR